MDPSAKSTAAAAIRRQHRLFSTHFDCLVRNFFLVRTNGQISGLLTKKKPGRDFSLFTFSISLTRISSLENEIKAFWHLQIFQTGMVECVDVNVDERIPSQIPFFS